MSKCKVCRRSVRKTQVAMVLVSGKLVGARVCATCVDKFGVTIVVARQVPHCKKPGCTEVATRCHMHPSGVSPELTGAIKVLEGRVKAARMTPDIGNMNRAENDGRIEGLESAIELLKSGRF